MADVRETRRRFTAVLIVLLVIDLAAAGLLFSPVGRGARSGHAKLQQLWAELQARTREVAPLKGIDQKVVAAKEEIGGFYGARFPTSYANISEQLGKTAAANGVKISNARYSTEPAPIPGLERVGIEISISADYLQEVKFINALERDKTFFLVESVNLQEAQAGSVRLQLRLETFRRTAEGT